MAAVGSHHRTAAVPDRLLEGPTRGLPSPDDVSCRLLAATDAVVSRRRGAFRGGRRTRRPPATGRSPAGFDPVHNAACSLRCAHFEIQPPAGSGHWFAGGQPAPGRAAAAHRPFRKHRGTSSGPVGGPHVPPGPGTDSRRRAGRAGESGSSLRAVGHRDPARPRSELQSDLPDATRAGQRTTPLAGYG